MLALSTGVAHSARILPSDFPGGNPDRETNAYSTQNTVVETNTLFRSTSSPSGSFCPLQKGVSVSDSVLARFTIQQPTNMEAYAMKVIQVESEQETHMMKTNQSGCLF